MLFMEPYRSTAYPKAATIFSTGFQMLLWPCTRQLLKVGPLTRARSSAGGPAGLGGGVRLAGAAGGGAGRMLWPPRHVRPWEADSAGGRGQRGGGDLAR